MRMVSYGLVCCVLAAGLSMAVRADDFMTECLVTGTQKMCDCMSAKDSGRQTGGRCCRNAQVQCRDAARRQPARSLDALAGADAGPRRRGDCSGRVHVAGFAAPWRRRRASSRAIRGRRVAAHYPLWHRARMDTMTGIQPPLVALYHPDERFEISAAGLDDWQRSEFLQANDPRHKLSRALAAEPYQPSGAASPRRHESARAWPSRSAPIMPARRK